MASLGLSMEQVIAQMEEMEVKPEFVKNYPIMKSVIAGFITDGDELPDEVLVTLNMMFAISWFKEIFQINKEVE
jgi:hypothetical protein